MTENMSKRQVKKHVVLLEVTQTCEGPGMDNVQIREWVQQHFEGCDYGTVRVQGSCTRQELDAPRQFKDMVQSVEEPIVVFTYEADGPGSRPTHYLLASSDAWSDPKRLNFDRKERAIKALNGLRCGVLTMQGAEAMAGAKWI